MESALVTGGAGFLGSHVAEQLLAAGLEVVVLDDLSGGFKANVPPAAVFRQGSITDRDLIVALFERHRFDYVFHFAAYAAEALSHFIREFNYANNLIGSVHLINAAVNYEANCFVFASSIAVYGDAPSPYAETTVPVPTDPYGIAKLTVEHDLRAAHEMFGLDYIVFRAHNVYGERQNLADPYRNVIGIFINQIKNGKPCTVFGDGSQTRDFTYIEDVAPLVARSIRVPKARNAVFNIGADSPCSVLELAEMVQETMRRRVGIEHLEPRREIVHAHADRADRR